MLFPVTVTKGKDKEKVYHAPDLKGWLDDGWKVEGETSSEKKSTPKKEEPIKGLDI